MKKIFLTSVFLALLVTSYGQSAEEYYLKGNEAFKAQKLEEAISYYDKSIDLKNDEYVAWYNRATAKLRLKRYEEAIPDFDQAIKLNPTHKKSFNGRASAKNDITDYEGALDDYNQAIKIDDKYIDALYNRGILYNLLSRREEACNDFNLAYSLGDEQSKSKAERCKEAPPKNIYPILRLTKHADNDTYGFTSENPVKTGPGPESGPANQRAYLDLLRDINCKPINYKRISSCCSYPSENGLFGQAMLDKYEIYYTNEKGEELKTFVYISFYDYEEPRILAGFKTVGQK